MGLLKTLGIIAAILLFAVVMVYLILIVFYLLFRKDGLDDYDIDLTEEEDEL